MSDYLIGSDVLGAGLSANLSSALASAQAAVAAPGTAGGPFLTIHVNNLSDVVAAQGGFAGALASKVVPQTIQNTVYGQLKDKLADALKQQGVDVTIGIVSTEPAGSPLPRDLYVGMGLGVVGVGVIYGLTELVKHFTGRK